VSSRGVIKKKDLPADQVEPVSIDAAAFEKRYPRIPRERVRIDADDAAPSPDRFAYLKQSIVRREQVTLSPNPVFVVDGDAEPVATMDAASPEDEIPADEPAEGDAPDPLDELRESLEAEWSAKVEAAREAAYRDGYNTGHVDGYEVGYADAEDDLEHSFSAHAEQLAADVAQLKTLWTEYIEASEPALLNMTIEIAEALLDAPLPESIQGASARAMAEAVEELAGAATLTVSLHPVDYQRLEENGLLDQLNANHEQTLHWNPDPNHREGDWSVESPTALIRHQKDETIDAIRQLLGATPPSSPGPPSPSDDDAA
jgi:flagellar assembly protein FliH